MKNTLYIITIYLSHLNILAKTQKDINYIFNETINLPQFVNCLANNQELITNWNHKHVVINNNGTVPNYINIQKGNHETLEFMKEEDIGKSTRNFMLGGIDYTFTTLKARKNKSIVEYKYFPLFKAKDFLTTTRQSRKKLA